MTGPCAAVLVNLPDVGRAVFPFIDKKWGRDSGALPVQSRTAVVGSPRPVSPPRAAELWLPLFLLSAPLPLPPPIKSRVFSTLPLSTPHVVSPLLVVFLCPHPTQGTKVPEEETQLHLWRRGF